MKHVIFINILLAGLVSLTACGGGGSAAPVTPTVPTSSFALSSTSPLDGATQKADFPVVAIFSEPVDEVLVDSSSFAVTDGVNPVVGTFSFSGDKTIVIFTPTSDLADGVSYTVTLSTNLAGSTSGESLAASQSWGFTASSQGNYACTVTTPPPELNLDAFYKQYCDANGIPIVGSAFVAPTTLQKVWSQVMNMIKMRQDLFAEVAKQGTRIAVLASGEVLTQLPEYSQFDTLFVSPLGGGSTWDDVKGLAAAPEYPVTVIIEDNVTCSVTDPLQGEFSLGHEFAHTVLNMGLDFYGAEGAAFNSQLTAIYNAAIAAGKWTDTYAASIQYEYWAEGVQDWFDGNNETTTPPLPDGVHGDINTQAELLNYDPALYSLISGIFPAEWKPVSCP